MTSLVAHFDDQIERRAFASVRRRLTLQSKALHHDTDVEERLAGFREAMVLACRRAETWTLEEEGYEAVAGGLGKTYERARQAMAEAHEAPSAERMHEWRKRVKYHWYHARLLQPMRAGMLEPHVAAADRLSQLLGDHHDLAVLDQRLQSGPDEFGGPRDIEAFAALIRQRQLVLAADSFALGRVLLAERKGALVSRWRAYWEVWQERAGPAEETILAT